MTYCSYRIDAGEVDVFLISLNASQGMTKVTKVYLFHLLFNMISRACHHLSFFIGSYSGRILVPLDFSSNYQQKCTQLIIQMEAERRRREAGIIQWIEKGSGHVYMFICL